MWRLLAIILVYGLLLNGLGCGSSPKIGKIPPASENLRILCHAYIEATDKMGRPPANFQDLAPYVKGKDNPDELKKSPGDNEEYVVFWNVDYRDYGRSGKVYPLLACERTGRDGKRWIFQLMNMMTIMPGEEIKKMPLPAGQQLPF